MTLTEKEIQDIKGLSEKEASRKLEHDGYNELPSSRRRSVLDIILEVFTEPMFILLVICGLLYVILGDMGEASMLLGFVFVIIGITVYQEGKAEKAIEALRDLSSPRALIIREGIQKRISGKEVVVQDIIILHEGDRVPADCILQWGMNLTVDESLLTGEAIPVSKHPSSDVNLELKKPGGDGSPYIFSGTLVVQGQGIAKVIATGIDTEMGKIGKVLSTIEGEQTFLQREIGRLVRSIFAVAMMLCLVIVVIYRLTRGNWIHGILSGITLAMAIMPEEFPVILTIFLALGAWRLSRKDILTRKVSAVEVLGASTVLCVDKTGTLTQNRMSIRKLFNGKDFFDLETTGNPTLSEAFHQLIEYGILASKKDPFDPMEKALEELGRKTLYNTEHIHFDWSLIEEYPLSKELSALSHVWKAKEGKEYLIATKGAPEAIADLCHLDAQAREALSRNTQIMAGNGLRVLGVAGSSFEKQALPQSQHDFDFRFIGLIGLDDPIRESVPEAIRECYDAGIRVVMITGDYSVTSQRIAKEIGLKYPNRVVTGPEIEKMDCEELRKKIREVNIFSRVVPEQKLLIVDALKANGETVAMTGDGVNDAPALKSAHIGIAMGERGTDVARESAGIVLLNDDFSSIVEAVRLGRRIFDNLKKAMVYIISVHMPIAGCALIPLLFGWPNILYPVHIVFLELIIDPACSIAFESEPPESNVMKRKPRDPKKPLFEKRLLFLSLLQGLFSLIIVLAIFDLSMKLRQSEAEARTLAFVTLIVSNICLILTNRTWSKTIISSFFSSNRALAGVIAAATVLLLVVIYVPFMREMFHFGTIHLADLIICLAAGIISVAWFEFLKFIFMKLKIDLM